MPLFGFQGFGWIAFILKFIQSVLSQKGGNNFIIKPENTQNGRCFGIFPLGFRQFRQNPR